MATREKTKASKGEGQQQKGKMSAVELVRLRNNFYRDNYRRLVSIAFFLVVLLVALGVTSFWLFTHRPAPQYFATNVQGGLIEIQPLNRPVLTTAELNSWATRAASAAFTLNYVQYRQQMESAIDTYFTNQGGQQYLKALSDSNDLKYIQAGKFIVTAKPAGAPRILARGIIRAGQLQGRYAWRVQVPLMVTAQNERQTEPSQLLVDLMIVRSSTMVDQTARNIDATRGIGIAELIATTKGTA